VVQELRPAPATGPVARAADQEAEDRTSNVVVRDTVDLDICCGTPIHIDDIVITAAGARG